MWVLVNWVHYTTFDCVLDSCYSPFFGELSYTECLRHSFCVSWLWILTVIFSIFYFGGFLKLPILLVFKRCWWNTYRPAVPWSNCFLAFRIGVFDRASLVVSWDAAFWVSTFFQVFFGCSFWPSVYVSVCLFVCACLSLAVRRCLLIYPCRFPCDCTLVSVSVIGFAQVVVYFRGLTLVHPMLFLVIVDSSLNASDLIY